MRKVTPYYFIIVTFLAFFILPSCNNHVADIPFPINDGYPQPAGHPLQLSAARGFHWDTVKTGGISPEIKKLDIDALPSTPYDSSSFKPYASAPEEVHFDFNALPDTTINIDKIPSQPLDFKTRFLPVPAAIKTSILTPKNGTTLSIAEIGKAQGIPTKTSFCFLKDKLGFIWIATDKGIFRYDGENMKLYTVHAASAMIEDNKGKIWWINGRAIGIIDPVLGTQSYSAKISSPFPKIPTLVKDEQGHIWVSQLSNFGVDIIDPESQTFKHLDKSTGIYGNDVWGIYQDDKKNIWLTTFGGATILNPATGKIKYLRKINGLSNDTAMAITGDKNGGVFVATYNSGFDDINIEKGSIKRYSKAQGFDNNIVYRLLYDNKNLLWIATDRGLIITDPAKKIINNLTEYEGVGKDYILDLLQDNEQRIWIAGYQTGVNVVQQNGELVYPIGTKTVSTLLEDAEGRIWVGTTAEGIAIIDPAKHVIRRLGKDEGISNNLIQDIVEANGNIDVTSNGGLDIIDPVHGTIEHIGKKEGLRSETIYEVLTDHNSNIFLTGPSEGVDMIDSAKNILLHAGVQEGLSDSNAVDVKVDNQGKIWVATFAKGVDVIDPAKGTIQSINNNSVLKDTSSKILMVDEYGRIWIGTEKGVFIADAKQNILTLISTKEGLCNNNINSLLQYQGKIIAGTTNKVSIITPATTTDTTWKVAVLAGSEGLVNGSGDWNSNAITKKGQYLWGDNGITVINEIKEEHDSVETYITGMSIMSDPQYFTDKLTLNEHDTISNMDSFFVKGQDPVNTGYVSKSDGFSWDSVSGPYNLPVNLEIPYDRNYIQFQFAQQHMGRFDTTSYCYILEGIDKHWSVPGSNDFTENYLNLSPGKYIFKVSSKQISGLWSKPATYSFTILSPWWQRWWAYLIYVLLFVIIIRRIIYYRSQKLIRENRLLEEKVEHRTNQLKQSIEDLKSTQTQLIQSEKMASLGELAAGIAHEIQNPLNFVNNFSEVNTELTDELKDELNKLNISSEEKLPIEQIANDIKQNQEKINFHGKRADSIVKGMLQHSRSSTGVKELTDINVLADEYLRLSYHGLRAKDKSFNATMKTDFDESIGKINIVPQDIGRVVLNLITNAFYSVTEKKKQQPEGYEPTVTVSTKKAPGRIEIIVKDNGNGIPQKVLDKIYQPFFTTKPTGQGTGLGLSMSYDIVTKGHGGELKVETKEGDGAQFIISLPA